MIFDYELMFIDDKNDSQQNISSGVLGSPIDLRVAGQGKGHHGLIAIAFTSDTTATGDPEISFSLETSDDCAFAESTKIPLSLPVPLKKENLSEGIVLSSQLPKIGLERYVRLVIDTESPIACTGIKAGFVFEATEI